MTTKTILSLTAILLLGACRSYEGVYRPDCIAYEGDIIEFANGRYTWDRFTDEIKVGDDGEALDAFPGFPRSGTYSVDGDQVQFSASDGGSTDTMYLQTIDGKHYLLTASQSAAHKSGAEPDGCKLVLQSDP